MSEPFVFDPRCDLCKEPFGAVPCGTAVTFHCRPLATEGFSHTTNRYSFIFLYSSSSLISKSYGASQPFARRNSLRRVLFPQSSMAFSTYRSQSA